MGFQFVDIVTINLKTEAAASSSTLGLTSILW